MGLYWGYIRVILGLYWGNIGVVLGDDGKENGNKGLERGANGFWWALD